MLIFKSKRFGPNLAVGLVLSLLIAIESFAQEVIPSIIYDTPSDQYVIKIPRENGEYTTRFELPNKIIPSVKLNVSQFTENGQRKFRYAYTLENSSNSPQNISIFGLEFKQGVEIHHSVSEVVELSEGETAAINELPKSPVQDIAMPAYWTESIYETDSGTLVLEWGWNAMKFPSDNIVYKDIGLRPGAQLGEFSFSSENPPVISPSIFLGEKRIEETFEFEPPDEVGEMLLERFHGPPFYVRKKTISPGPPISSSVELCDTFILDLIAHVREAVALGWIKHDLRKDRDDDADHGKGKGDEKGKKKGHGEDDDEDDNGDDDDMDDADKRLPGVAKSIIKKLTKVRRECLRGKFGSVREKLRALIRQVNAQREKHLTEEAYALIKFNSEFLLEKL